ncbi:MAG TPA: hypothetical protein VJT32_03050 [bacterium]|nr:hypothetical protein [bacterium]
MLDRGILLLVIAAVGVTAAGGHGEGGPAGLGRIAFVSTRDWSAQIYVMNGDGSHVVQLTKPSAEYYAPAFSQDGRTIAFVSTYNEIHQIATMNADGSQVTH